MELFYEVFADYVEIIGNMIFYKIFEKVGLDVTWVSGGF
jgi:hypothetical protein